MGENLLATLLDLKFEISDLRRVLLPSIRCNHSILNLTTYKHLAPPAENSLLAQSLVFRQVRAPGSSFPMATMSLFTMWVANSMPSRIRVRIEVRRCLKVVCAGMWLSVVCTGGSLTCELVTV